MNSGIPALMEEVLPCYWTARIRSTEELVCGAHWVDRESW
jgi:hypothetical protein